MLARDVGSSGPQIADELGWAPHTVRGFLAGLAEEGITVEVLEHVRQIGPNKTGAKGNYTVYHVAEVPSRNRSRGGEGDAAHRNRDRKRQPLCDIRSQRSDTASMPCCILRPGPAHEVG